MLYSGNLKNFLIRLIINKKKIDNYINIHFNFINIQLNIITATDIPRIFNEYLNSPLYKKQSKISYEYAKFLIIL